MFARASANRIRTSSESFDTDSSCKSLWHKYCEVDGDILVQDDFYKLCDVKVQKLNAKNRLRWLKDHLKKLCGDIYMVGDDALLVNGSELTKVVLRYGSIYALNYAVTHIRETTRSELAGKTVQLLGNSYRGSSDLL